MGSGGSTEFMLFIYLKEKYLTLLHLSSRLIFLAKILPGKKQSSDDFHIFGANGPARS